MSTLPTPGASSSSNPPTQNQLQIQIRPIPPSLTIPLRHSVLWPHKPKSYVLLPEDEGGWHFGAFLLSPGRQDTPSGDGEGIRDGGGAEGYGYRKDDGDGDGNGGEEPIAVISCFLEPLPEDVVSHNSSPSVPSDSPRSSDPASTPSSPPSEQLPKTARIRKFATHPTFQRQGVGSKLLKHVLEFATAGPGAGGGGGGLACRKVWCDARYDARGFYERFGMRVVTPSRTAPPGVRNVDGGEEVKQVEGEEEGEGEGEGEGEEEGPTFYKEGVPYVRMVLDLDAQAPVH